MCRRALLSVFLVGIAVTSAGGQPPAVAPTPAEALLVAAFPELRQQRVTWTRTETADGVRLEARIVSDPFAASRPAPLLEATAALDQAGLVTLAVSGPLTDAAPGASNDGSLLAMPADSTMAPLSSRTRSATRSLGSSAYWARATSRQDGTRRRVVRMAWRRKRWSRDAMRRAPRGCSS